MSLKFNGVDVALDYHDIEIRNKDCDTLAIFNRAIDLDDVVVEVDEEYLKAYRGGVEVLSVAIYQERGSEK